MNMVELGYLIALMLIGMVIGVRGYPLLPQLRSGLARIAGRVTAPVQPASVDGEPLLENSAQ